MKLDHDVARNLLLAIENSKDISGLEPNEQSKVAVENNVSERELAYIESKLFEAGFITNKPLYGSDDFYSFYPTQLTYDGHQYLDNVRSSKVWRQSKSVASKIGSVSLQMMADIASGVITKLINPR